MDFLRYKVYYGQLLKGNKSVIKFKSFHAWRGFYLLFIVFCLVDLLLEQDCNNPKCFVVFFFFNVLAFFLGS